MAKTVHLHRKITPMRMMPKAAAATKIKMLTMTMTSTMTTTLTTTAIMTVTMTVTMTRTTTMAMRLWVAI